MRSIRATLVGAMAAAAAPRYSVLGRLDPLLAPRSGRRRWLALDERELLVALAAAARTNARLARRAPRLWRDTCLYRAIAECLVRRAAGADVVVRLGVRRAADGSVEAHAWVDGESTRAATFALDGYQALASPRPAR